jgi:hypothetical protein
MLVLLCRRTRLVGKEASQKKNGEARQGSAGKNVDAERTRVEGKNHGSQSTEWEV